MRLLREDDVLDIIERVTNETVEKRQHKYKIQQRLVGEILCLESVDAALIKHGRWIVKNGNGEYGWCSECGNRSWTQWDGVMPIPLLTPFCPYCSARMDKEAEK